MTENDADLLCN